MFKLQTKKLAKLFVVLQRNNTAIPANEEDN